MRLEHEIGVVWEEADGKYRGQVEKLQNDLGIATTFLSLFSFEILILREVVTSFETEISICNEDIAVSRIRELEDRDATTAMRSDEKELYVCGLEAERDYLQESNAKLKAEVV